MEILISAGRIQERVAQLAVQVTRDLREPPVTIVGVLTGSLMFLADLVRHPLQRGGDAGRGGEIGRERLFAEHCDAAIGRRFGTR